MTTNCNVKIINLERRPDRKENMENLIFNNKSQLFENYEFIKAVDGNELEPTEEIMDLFKDNIFGSRKGVIGCSLSHYYLWKELINDDKNEYYIILEDDIRFTCNFSDKIKNIEKHFVDTELLFLGYHMFKRVRDQVKNVYDDEECIEINIKKLCSHNYIGGTFGYTINKKGAFKLLKYIEINGIKHGIDYVMKCCYDRDNIDAYECQPLLLFSEWNESNNNIDTDIQRNHDKLF
jgi:collagen beta-1,O-galactosyltransferase